MKNLEFRGSKSKQPLIGSSHTIAELVVARRSPDCYIERLAMELNLFRVLQHQKLIANERKRLRPNEAKALSEFQ